MYPGVIKSTHPLIQHKLSILRAKQTCSSKFRKVLKEASLLMAYEVFKDLPTITTEIETPLERMKSQVIDEEKIALVSVLRAGNGLLDGFLELLPDACVGHVGLFREHDTLKIVEYYFKMPANLSEMHVVILDPMLATGSSAAVAIEKIKALNPKSLKFVCLLAAPEGIKNLNNRFPDLPIYTAAVDRELNDQAYILPGLGDAGDRIYGT